MDIRLLVHIDNQWGSFKRIGDVYTLPASQFSNNDWSVPNACLSYPDSNCTKIDVLFYDGSVWRTARSLTTTKSKTANLAFASVIIVKLIGGEPVDIPTLEAESAITVEDKRRFVASEVNIPFVFRASKTYYVDDEITTFGTNAMDISSGQFGAYPLFVFTKRSREVYSVDTGSSDVFLSSKVPASITRGCHNNRTIVNAGQLVVVGNDAGIFIITGSQEERISDPVWDDLKNTLDSMMLTYHEDGEIREIWVHNGTAYYIFNLDHKKWYKSVRNRSFSFSHKGQVYGVIGLLLVKDTTYDNGSITGVISYKNCDFEAPEYYKKVQKVFLRGEMTTPVTTNDFDGQEIVNSGTVFRGIVSQKWKPSVVASFGLDSWFQSLDVEFEPRRTHRRGFV